MCFASDWPVADVSVLRGLQASQTRQPYGPDCADERLALMDSLRAYTAGGAWAAHLEGVTGCLRVGLAADLVLLGGDIESVEAGGISGLGITLTVCGGQITHQAPEIA